MIKKKIFTILMSLAMVITMMPMMAGVAFAGSTAPVKGDDFTVGNLSYTVLDNEQHVVVRKADNLKASELTGTVVVPEVVTYAGVKYTVKEVQDFAFKNCKNIKSMVLGMCEAYYHASNSLKIGRQAFKNCTGMRNFTVGTCRLDFVKVMEYDYNYGYEYPIIDAFEGVGTESNPCWFNKIDTGLYAGKPGDKDKSNMILSAFNVPQVTTDDGWIGYQLNTNTPGFTNSGAYFVCTNLYSLYTPEEHNQELWSVCIPNAESSADADDTYTLVYGGYGKGIKANGGKYYFPNYAKISKVIIPETTGMEDIDSYAFAGLGSEAGIDEIVIPSTVKSVGDYAFADCNVKNVTFGENVEQVRSFAFADCDVENVTFGKNVEKVGERVFDGCTSLQKVTFKSTPHYYQEDGSSTRYIGLDQLTFEGMAAIPKLSLPVGWFGKKFNSTNWYGGKFTQYLEPSRCPKLTAKKYGKKSFKLSWKKISGAKYYVVQGAKKGKTLKTVVKTSKNTYKVKKLSGKTLKKGSKYRMRVLVYDKNGNLIGKSSIITKKR